MPKSVNCRYFYGDYFRGKNKEECRLLAANPSNQRPWHRKLCDSCPVPEIMIASNSRELAIEAEVKRLEALGASLVKRVQTWCVMQAPTGQRFCVVRAGTKDFAERANRWDTT